MAAGPLDTVAKTLLQEGGPDLVAWLTGRRPIEARPAVSELPVAETRLADTILRVVFPRATPAIHYLHLET